MYIHFLKVGIKYKVRIVTDKRVNFKVTAPRSKDVLGYYDAQP